MDLDKSFDPELCFDSIEGSPTSSTSTTKDTPSIKVSPMKRSAAKSPLFSKPNNGVKKMPWVMCPRISPIVGLDGTHPLERIIMNEPLHRLTPTNGEAFRPINEDDNDFLTTMFKQWD